MANYLKPQPISFSNDAVKGMRLLTREQHYQLKVELANRGDRTPDEVFMALKEQWMKASEGISNSLT